MTAAQLPKTDKIRVAVVTGGHPFDVPAFRDMYNGMPRLDVYLQDLDNWAASRRNSTYGSYDAFVFYNMHSSGILSVRKDIDKEITDALTQLGDSNQGIFILHHALLAFPDMQVWSDVCDIQNRKLRLCKPPEPICTLVANEEHPVTEGLDDWEMNDEIYLMDTPTQASQILLKTNHPESMPTLAWAHQYRNAEVLCYQAGHDARAFTNPNFQALLARGIEWLARRR